VSQHSSHHRETDPGRELRANISREGTWEEMAGPVLMLATAAGSYCNGTEIVIDGGWHLVSCLADFVSVLTLERFRSRHLSTKCPLEMSASGFFLIGRLSLRKVNRDAKR